MPPASLEGVTVTVAKEGGRTKSVAVSVTVPTVADIVADAWARTGEVFSVSVALGIPSGTVTVVAVVTSALLLETVKVVPPAGAIPLRYTVPIEGVPPTTDVGVRIMPVGTAGVTMNPLVAEEAAALALIVR